MIPKQNCLSCQRLLWDSDPEFKPEMGMKSVCAFCGNVTKFDKNYKLKPTNKISKNAKENSDFIKFLVRAGIPEENIHEYLMRAEFERGKNLK